MNKSRIPSWKQLRHINKVLSSRELWLLRVSVAVMALSALLWGGYVYSSNLQTVPVSGGVYTEALIGRPAYVNPLYAVSSDVDNDISQLVYSSLFTRGRNGELVPDLVEEFFVSDENKTYTFRIRDDAKWHDGQPLTADDVVFTFAAIQDSELKSPLRASFGGVRIERMGEYRFRMLLDDPYAAFLELLTFGIMPEHLWSQVQADTYHLAQLNLRPVGSGPYLVKGLTRDGTSGQIRSYELEPNPDYYGEQPMIELSFMFFSSFEEAVMALNNGLVNGMSYLPLDYRSELLTPKSFDFHRLYLPQLTTLFFNQTRNPALGNKEVRQALAHALDKEALINEVLKGNAYAVDSPILSSSFAYKADIRKYEFNRRQAEELLAAAGWEMVEIDQEETGAAEAELDNADDKARQAAELIVAMGPGQWRQKDGNYLIIHLLSVDRNENAQVLDHIKSSWESIGVKTVVEIMPFSRIQKEAIAPRNFDVLFYGQIVGADPDPYPFWHSSQTGPGGYNIANFSDKNADKLLEDARKSSDRGERQQLYWQFQDILAEELPSIFMYSPVYTYVQHSSLKGFDVASIQVPRNRFANVAEWYLKTEKKFRLEQE